MTRLFVGKVLNKLPWVRSRRIATGTTTDQRQLTIWPTFRDLFKRVLFFLIKRVIEVLFVTFLGKLFNGHLSLKPCNWVCALIISSRGRSVVATFPSCYCAKLLKCPKVSAPWASLTGANLTNQSTNESSAGQSSHFAPIGPPSSSIYHSQAKAPVCRRQLIIWLQRWLQVCSWLGAPIWRQRMSHRVCSGSWQIQAKANLRDSACWRFHLGNFFPLAVASFAYFCVPFRVHTSNLRLLFSLFLSSLNWPSSAVMKCNEKQLFIDLCLSWNCARLHLQRQPF